MEIFKLAIHDLVRPFSENVKAFAGVGSELANFEFPTLGEAVESDRDHRKRFFSWRQFCGAVKVTEPTKGQYSRCVTPGLVVL